MSVLDDRVEACQVIRLPGALLVEIGPVELRGSRLAKIALAIGHRRIVAELIGSRAAERDIHIIQFGNMASPERLLDVEAILLNGRTGGALVQLLIQRQLPRSKDAGLGSGLHRNSAYRCRRAALASASDPSGRTDKTPVLIQSCRMSNVRKAIFLAPIKSAWRV